MFLKRKSRSNSRSLFVMTQPPSPLARVLLCWKLNEPMSPRLPSPLPFHMPRRMQPREVGAKFPFPRSVPRPVLAAVQFHQDVLGGFIRGWPDDSGRLREDGGAAEDGEFVRVHATRVPSRAFTTNGQNRQF